MLSQPFQSLMCILLSEGTILRDLSVAQWLRASLDRPRMMMIHPVLARHHRLDEINEAATLMMNTTDRPRRRDGTRAGATTWEGKSRQESPFFFASSKARLPIDGALRRTALIEGE